MAIREPRQVIDRRWEVAKSTEFRVAESADSASPYSGTEMPLLVADGLPVRAVCWTVYCPVRYIQPAALTFLVDPLKPNREP
jgi:hypothetical protein